MVKESYTHDLVKLVKLANLNGALVAQAQADPQFDVNWAVVKDWNETSRYRILSQSEATDLISAITQRGHGVFRWTRQHW
jgi:hypothetical protein